MFVNKIKGIENTAYIMMHKQKYKQKLAAYYINLERLSSMSPY